MSSKRTIYRDYRKGHHGEFTTKKKWENQGLSGEITRERVEIPEEIDDVDILFDYEQYDQDDFVEQEYHGTGDTGRRE
jgi:hypothetical protein